MRVLLAGASGTLARALLPQLVASGHDVIGLGRRPGSAERIRALGGTPVVADVLDRDALLSALAGHRADAVIHELTALQKPPTSYRAMTATNVLRTTGTENLLAAAEQLWATRFLTQSIVFGYGYRRRHAGPVDESTAFGGVEGLPTDPTVVALARNEDIVRTASGMEGIALRYGLFYGLDADTVTRMLRRRSLPASRAIGAVPFIHQEDAAAATVAALERGIPGSAYNVTDGTRQTWAGYLDDAARAFGTAAPLRVPIWMLRRVAPYAAELMTRMDLEVTSAKARKELGWAPRFGTTAAGWAHEAGGRAAVA
jgi:nucleoside-diphosphate-sugar epimerase